MNNFKKNILTLPIFIFASVLFTFPLIVNMNTSIYGIMHDNMAAPFYSWALNKNTSGEANLKKFDYVNYPKGVNLVPEICTYTHEVLTRISSYLFANPYFAVNILLLLKFTLAGFFMYFLIKLLLSSWLISVAGGLIYAFNPYMVSVARAYGSNFISAFLPLVVYAFIILLRKKNFKSLLFFTLCVIIFFGENFYYSFFTITTLIKTLILWFLIFLFYVIITGKLKKYYCLTLKFINLKYVGLFIVFILAGIICYLTAYKLFYVDLQRSYGIEYLKNVMSSKGEFFFIPAIDHFLFGKYFINYYFQNSYGVDNFELSKYIGIIPFCVIVFAWVNYKKLANLKNWLIFFTLTGICSGILSLGPTIDIFGNTIIGPQFIINKLVNSFRNSSRYQLITYFSIVICFCIGLKIIVSRQKKRIFKIASVSLLSILVFMEYCSYSYDHIVRIVDTMPKAYRYLAKDKRIYPILETPVDWYRIRIHTMAFQPIHNKKLRTYVHKQSNQPMNLFNPKDQLNAWKNGFKYWVVLKNIPPVTTYPLSGRTPSVGLHDFQVQENFGYLKLVKDWKDSALYKLTDNFPKNGVFACFGPQHFLKKYDRYSTLKWTKEKYSEILIFSGSNINELQITFQAWTIGLEKKVSVFFNTKIIKNVIIGKNLKDYSLVLHDIQKGKNIIGFKNNTGLTNIAKTLKTMDPRTVGFKIGAIKIKETNK